MDYRELNEYMNSHERLDPGTAEFECMKGYAYKAEKIMGELNSGYHDPAEVKQLLEKLIGKPVPDGVRVALPFYTDYGKNIDLSEGVFINTACQFQDQGGIFIGKNTLIGPKVVIATINHGLEPDRRGLLMLQGVEIGANVWIGASSVILPGVKIGDNSVVAAGAVVNKDVEANTVVGGVPAKLIRRLDKK